jgi:hypothetical protein
MSSAEPADQAGAKELTARAQTLAAAIAAKVEAGDLDGLPPEAIQALAAAVCRAYAAHQEAEHRYPIFSGIGAATGTDVMVTCSALLKAADLQVFELGMWSSWTGR